MTFTLTEECLFCHKPRTWATIIKTFPDSEAKKYGALAGQTVTVCRNCRKEHTVEELIEKAKEVF